MGVGILEDKHLEVVPGTAIFSEDPNAAALAAFQHLDIHKLKHATGKHSEIILVPQPSDDPNDPLNWPRWRKHAYFATVFFGTAVVGVIGPLLAADQPGIAAAFNTDVQGISRVLGSYTVLTLAIATVLLQPIAAKFGKRPVFLGCGILLIAGPIWSSYCNSLGNFTASKVVTGIAMAPLEFLVGSSIADIYFLHERGLYVSLWNVALLQGIALTPPIAGPILQSSTLGWRWALRIYAVFAAVILVLQYFFQPETNYIRKTNLPSSVAQYQKIDHEKGSATDFGHLENAQPSYGPKKTFWQEAAIFSRVWPTRSSFPMLVLQPFFVLLTPGLIYGGLVYGLAITWLVVLATSFAILFAGPPYNFGPTESGLIYMSPFIFNAIALAIQGPLSDYLARVMSKRNKGIFEPEFRLLNVFFYFVFGAGGLLGFGLTLAHQLHWAVPVVFFGLISFGITMGTGSVVGYVIDMHRNQASAAVAALIFWKNIYSFGFTWNVVNWILADGVDVTFAWIAGLSAFTALLTIPMYIFGKRARSLIHRKVHFEGEGDASH